MFFFGDWSHLVSITHRMKVALGCGVRNFLDRLLLVALFYALRYMIQPNSPTVTNIQDFLRIRT